MTRGRLNRLMLVPAALIAVGLLAFVIYPRLQQPAPVSEVCSLSQTGQAPSGRTLTLCQIVTELQPSGDVWAVVRVIDPNLPDTAAIPDHSDHDWACATWGLSALDISPRPQRIIVQLMAEPFERGEPNPGITQSIEAYSIEDDACQWEFL